jgi:hypothetical protein
MDGMRQTQRNTATLSIKAAANYVLIFPTMERNLRRRVVMRWRKFEYLTG